MLLPDNPVHPETSADYTTPTRASWLLPVVAILSSSGWCCP